MRNWNALICWCAISAKLCTIYFFQTSPSCDITNKHCKKEQSLYSSPLAFCTSYLPLSSLTSFWWFTAGVALPFLTQSMCVSRTLISLCRLKAHTTCAQWVHLRQKHALNALNLNPAHVALSELWCAIETCCVAAGHEDSGEVAVAAHLTRVRLADPLHRLLKHLQADGTLN